MKPSAFFMAISLFTVTLFGHLNLASAAAKIEKKESSSTLKAGSDAPLFTATLHSGKEFKLSDRKGKGWTVLYFYPKAETPGCTTQACAFRENVNILREYQTEVYGISTDDVTAQKKFHDKEKLKFDLIADPEAKVTEMYSVKMPLVKIAKRWTFIVDPELKIRWINDNVDPAKDPLIVKDKLVEMGVQRIPAKTEKKK